LLVQVGTANNQHRIPAYCAHVNGSPALPASNARPPITIEPKYIPVGDYEHSAISRNVDIVSGLEAISNPPPLTAIVPVGSLPAHRHHVIADGVNRGERFEL
jgi:hypothetical protein